MFAERSVFRIKSRLATLACSMPGSQNNSNQQSNLAATITAQALIIQNSTKQAAIKHPIIRTPHPKNAPAISLSSTPGVPMVSVSTATNCRTGPSTDYDLIYTLDVGQTAEVVGKYSGGNYWVIKTPSGGGNCWLWGEYATISGDVDNLPEMIPPPAPPTAVPTVKKIKPWRPFIPMIIPTATPTIILAPPYHP
jgi:hypothetical protein